MTIDVKPPSPGTTLGEVEMMFANGWQVIPLCGSTKTPYWEWRTDKRAIPYTIDLFERVRSERPDHVSTGIPCGTVSGVAPVAVDFDIDDKFAGVLADALKAVVAAMGESLFERKGRKGTMLIYRNLTQIPKIRVEGIAPDGSKQAVEFLGDGQQFAAYGLHPKSGKPYEWVNFGLEPLLSPFDDVPEVTPDQIRAAAVAVEAVFRASGFTFKTTADRKREASAAKGAPIYWDELQAAVAAVGGQCEDRNKWLSYMGLKFAGAYHRETFEPVQEEEKFELFDRWASGEFSDAGQPRSYQDAADCLKTWDDTNEDDVGLGALLNDAKAAGWKGSTRIPLMDYADAGPECEPPPDQEAKPDQVSAAIRELEQHTWRGEGITKRSVRREFVIPRVLPAAGMTAFIAYRGCGKTTVLTDMALRLAHDMPWHGVPMKTGWAVIYLTGEDAEGVQQSVGAWKIKNGVASVSDRFILMDEMANLLDDDAIRNVWIPHFKRATAGYRVVVIYDTWQRATATGKQNDDDVQQRAIANVERIAKALSGPAIVAAHPPKEDMKTNSKRPTMHGSAVTENHAYALWVMTMAKDGTRTFAIPDKIKGARPGFSALFQFEEIDLGEKDEWGQPCSALVPVKVGGEGRSNLMEQADTTTPSRATEDERTMWADLADHFIQQQPARANSAGPDAPMPWAKLAKAICAAYRDRTLPERFAALFDRDPTEGNLRAHVLPEQFKGKRVPITRKGPGDSALAVGADVNSAGRATGVRVVAAD